MRSRPRCSVICVGVAIHAWGISAAMLNMVYLALTKQFNNLFSGFGLGSSSQGLTSSLCTRYSFISRKVTIAQCPKLEATYTMECLGLKSCWTYPQWTF